MRLFRLVFLLLGFCLEVCFQLLDLELCFCRFLFVIVCVLIGDSD